MAEDDAVEHAYLLASRMDYTITYHDKEISLTAKIKLAKTRHQGNKDPGITQSFVYNHEKHAPRVFSRDHFGNKGHLPDTRTVRGRCPFA